ncbi:MAG TPA: CrcB family protein [Solirubrobacteraceae bacterium]|jgi:CrcB protein
MTYLGVAVAGALGAVARYLVDRAVARWRYTVFPLGTLLVNVSGSFLAGLVLGLVLYHGLASTPAVVIGIGFLGAYTTLSTFSFESLRLLESGAVLLGLANAAGSLVAGLLAAGAGLALGAL